MDQLSPQLGNQERRRTLRQVRVTPRDWEGQTLSTFCIFHLPTCFNLSKGDTTKPFMSHLDHRRFRYLAAVHELLVRDRVLVGGGGVLGGRDGLRGGSCRLLRR